MDSEPFECLAIKAAKQLVEEIKRTAGHLPDDLDATGYVPPVLAEIRHEYTNYDEVLFRLPGIGVPGIQYPDDEPRCPCPFYDAEAGISHLADGCNHYHSAYLEIKSRANDIARDLIDEQRVR